jgi:hypothetical protein
VEIVFLTLSDHRFGAFAATEILVSGLEEKCDIEPLAIWEDYSWG